MTRSEAADTTSGQAATVPNIATLGVRLLARDEQIAALKKRVALLDDIANKGAYSTYHAPDCTVTKAYANYEVTGEPVSVNTPCSCIVMELRRAYAEAWKDAP